MRQQPAAASTPQPVEQQSAFTDTKAREFEKPNKEADGKSAVVMTGEVAGVKAEAADAVAEMRAEGAPGALPAAPAAAAPAPPPPAALNATGEGEGRRSTVQSERLMAKAARADEASVAPPQAVFGLSIDPSAFDRVRRTLEQGERPEPGSIDVAAVVNYLAGTSRPSNEVNLEVEASRAPIDLGTVLIRFTVETARATASLPAVATNASLTISLNPSAVVSHHLIGADTLKEQSTLPRNVSVTGLVDVELKPGLQPWARIATLRLRYRSTTDGRMHTIDRDVRAAQVMRKWESASLRHRLATLGAIWSQSINGGEATGEMAQRAEKLATEAPENARARALAAAASAFSRLRSSGPTGSGR